MKNSKDTSNEKSSNNIQVNNIFSQNEQDFKSILKEGIKSIISNGCSNPNVIKSK